MQKNICITHYDAICNMGENIDMIFDRIITAPSNFEINDSEFGIKGKFGQIFTNFPDINDENFNTRSNKILRFLVDKNKDKFDLLFEKYSKNRIGIVVSTTNSGVEEFVITKNISNSEIGNCAQFLKDYIKLEGFCLSVSSACSSGVKAFSVAQRVINMGFCDAVIVAGVDALTKVPIYGFNSLEVLSDKQTNPFSKNRNGINIGEGGAIFIVEKGENDFVIKGIGETSDAYHTTTPDPDGKQAQIAIEKALYFAELTPEKIDYINLHGTGTIVNDAMEAIVINNIFPNIVPASSTKPFTGHCLGAASSIETAICCHCIKYNVIPPHLYDGEYDISLPSINLVTKTVKKKINNVLCNAFGFGGANSVLVIGRSNNYEL